MNDGAVVIHRQLKGFHDVVTDRCSALDEITVHQAAHLVRDADRLAYLTEQFLQKMLYRLLAGTQFDLGLEPGHGGCASWRWYRKTAPSSVTTTVCMRTDTRAERAFMASMLQWWEVR